MLSWHRVHTVITPPRRIIPFCLLLLLGPPVVAQDGQWLPVTGVDTLRDFISGLTAERTLPNGEVSRGEYFADGTGTLFAWGAAVPRTWSIKGDDRICIAENGPTVCYRLERNAVEPDRYRARDVLTGRSTEFRLTDDTIVLAGDTSEIGNEGGKATPKYVTGVFPNHQWDIGGSGNKDISLTTIQPFYTYLPGGGWSVGTGPAITYDWEATQWTVPLQINAGKTVVIGGRPWKFSAELNYYVEKPDTFGPEWMLGINVAPVVKNGLASWFGL